jgi:rRNA-processing protein FCF1
LTGRRSASSSDARKDRAPRALVLLDTNSLLLPWPSGTRIVDEVARLLGDALVVVPSTALGELDRLEARGLRSTVVARRLAAQFPVVPAEPAGDGSILALARSEGAWVLTADRGFRTRLLTAGIRVLYPRHGGSLVAFEAPPARRGRPAVRATVKKRPPLAGRSGGRRRAAR